MSVKRRHLIIDARGNVATAITDLRRGETLHTQHGPITLRDPIRYGHKFALTAIAPDEYIIKYGDAIGRATAPIRPGDHVHVHNVVDIVNEVRK